MTAAAHWRLSWRADPIAKPIADRHYNRQNPDADQFVPPGRCLVLLAGEPATALWITSWPFAEHVKHAWPGAWVNTTFRNEGYPAARSSALIREAVAITRWKWPTVPAAGMVTMVDPDEVEAKDLPGYCYLRAGFRYVGRTLERDLLVLQLLERRMANPVEPLPRAGALLAV